MAVQIKAENEISSVSGIIERLCSFYQSIR